MFKLRYNVLALFQLSLGFVVYVFFIKFFGADYKTDAYFLAEAMFTSIQLLQLMFVEQFLYFYQDIKNNEGKISAFEFYKFSIFISLFIGLFSVILLYLSSNFLIDLFNSGLDKERKDVLEEIWNIFIVGNMFTLINYVNTNVLNAENRFSIPYLLESLPSLCIIIIFIYMVVFSIEQIEFIAYAKVTGFSLTALFSFYFIRRLGIPVGVRTSHKKAKEFIKNSFTMRFGHNIHNFLFVPITNNILSMLPSGFASYFFYALKFVKVVYALVVGPQFRVFQSRVSNEWYKGNVSNVLKLMRKYILLVLPFFFISVLMFYFLLPFFFSLLGKTLSNNEVTVIGYLFLLMSSWYSIILLESIFVMISIVSKDSKIFIITNTIFIVVYFLLSWMFKDKAGVYTIPLAALLAQLMNFLFYTKYALKKLNIRLFQIIRGKETYGKAS